ncbi:hypothetical protein SB775_25915 [Peribacillus sp. SIMBA_075]|uniref:hypothetical protein n=1 Tax=Peribacillus sp. SIMBA_075 TaxID=3085813 RepID=UPI00397B73B7
MKIKSWEWLGMTRLDRYMEIYRAYVRSQNKRGEYIAICHSWKTKGSKFHSCVQSDYGYEDSYLSRETAEKEKEDVQALFLGETFSVVEVHSVEKIVAEL